MNNLRQRVILILFRIFNESVFSANAPATFNPSQIRISFRCLYSCMCINSYKKEEYKFHWNGKLKSINKMDQYYPEA